MSPWAPSTSTTCSSRFNFQAQVDDIVEDDPDSGLTATYTFNDPERFRLRNYQGRLVHGKNPADQDTIADRIAAMDLDVLCAQEVEDIDTLRFFVAQHLEGRYRFLVLVEGNDPRLIDLAVLSKPAGGGRLLAARLSSRGRPSRCSAATCWRSRSSIRHRVPAVHRVQQPSQEPVRPLRPGPGGRQAGQRRRRRRRQAETVERIVAARTRPDSRLWWWGT